MVSNGVAIIRGHELVTSGICPSEGDILTLAQWLLKRRIDPIFSTDHLSDLYQPAKAFEAVGTV